MAARATPGMPDVYKRQAVVGKGIRPDNTVLPTLAGIRNGKDEVLDAAVQMFKK